jgi:selenide,water dikinase
MVRVLLVGGGHAMLPTIVRSAVWVRDGLASVRLFDAHPRLYYSGMVPELLGGVYQRRDVSIELDALCERAGIPFRAHAIAKVNVDEQAVVDASGASYPYDLLVLNVGGRNPALPAAATPTKPLHRLPDVNRRVRGVLHSPGDHLHLCIAGGGAAGVEIALNVSARFQAAGRHHDLSCTVVEAEDALLPGFPRGLQAHVKQRLVRRGVDVFTGVRVTTATESEVTLSDGRRLPSDGLLWATGVKGPEVLTSSDLPVDARGFVKVSRHLQVCGHPRILAAGDSALVDGDESLGRIGVHAVKQGHDLVKNLERSIHSLHRSGAPPSPDTLRVFRPYPVAPLILSTGEPDGLWVERGIWWHGRSALRMKHWLDRRWIHAYNGAFPPRGVARVRADSALS